MTLSSLGVLCLVSLPQAITLLAEAPEGRRWLQHLVNRVGGAGGEEGRDWGRRRNETQWEGLGRT